ncbi:hypothetical protein HK101_009671 [Irineochytrium annulatum]|nr:hypothetical protein HK101_009671 [Irineochytrium annulatum]
MTIRSITFYHERIEEPGLAPHFELGGHIRGLLRVTLDAMIKKLTLTVTLTATSRITWMDDAGLPHEASHTVDVCEPVVVMNEGTMLKGDHGIPVSFQIPFDSTRPSLAPTAQKGAKIIAEASTVLSITMYPLSWATYRFTAVVSQSDSGGEMAGIHGDRILQDGSQTRGLEGVDVREVYEISMGRRTFLPGDTCEIAIALRPTPMYNQTKKITCVGTSLRAVTEIKIPNGLKRIAPSERRLVEYIDTNRFPDPTWGQPAPGGGGASAADQLARKLEVLIPENIQPTHVNMGFSTHRHVISIAIFCDGNEFNGKPSAVVEFPIFIVARGMPFQKNAMPIMPRLAPSLAGVPPPPPPPPRSTSVGTAGAEVGGAGNATAAEKRTSVTATPVSGSPTPPASTQTSPDRTAEREDAEILKAAEEHVRTSLAVPAQAEVSVASPIAMNFATSDFQELDLDDELDPSGDITNSSTALAGGIGVGGRLGGGGGGEMTLQMMERSNFDALQMEWGKVEVSKDVTSPRTARGSGEGSLPGVGNEVAARDNAGPSSTKSRSSTTVPPTEAEEETRRKEAEERRRQDEDEAELVQNTNVAESLADLLKPGRYSALYVYEPAYPVEMRVDAGDIVFIRSVAENGWGAGVNETRVAAGQINSEGFVPMHFLCRVIERNLTADLSGTVGQQTGDIIVTSLVSFFYA